MRSLLLVPGNSGRKLERGFDAGADTVVLDLEESVSSGEKALARQLAHDALAARPASGPAVYVRINDLSTGLADDDLAAIVPARPDGIVLPRPRNLADVQHLATKLRVEEIRAGLPDGGIAIIPVITETPLATLSAATYAGSSPRLGGLAWDAEALRTRIGANALYDDHGRYTDVFRLARALTLLSASASGVPAIDTAHREFRDIEGLREACAQGRRDGFSAKFAIHPAQVPVINEMFAPSPAHTAPTHRP